MLVTFHRNFRIIFCIIFSVLIEGALSLTCSLILLHGVRTVTYPVSRSERIFQHTKCNLERNWPRKHLFDQNSESPLASASLADRHFAGNGEKEILEMSKLKENLRKYGAFRITGNLKPDLTKNPLQVAGFLQVSVQAVREQWKMWAGSKPELSEFGFGFWGFQNQNISIQSFWIF